MRLGRFIEFFTKEADPDERMTEAEARISFLREPKKRVKVYSIKRQQMIEVEVVSVATGLTRHNEHIGAERHTATEVVETVNNATEQQIDAARAKVLTAISDSFDDDMFAEIWPQKKKHTRVQILGNSLLNNTGLMMELFFWKQFGGPTTRPTAHTQTHIPQQNSTWKIQ